MRLAQKEVCPHPSTTLVQAATTIDFDESLEPFDVWFASHQCDLCGVITQKPVSAEEVDQASNAPWLDEDAYLSATEERLEGQSQWLALMFMAKAVRR